MTQKDLSAQSKEILESSFTLRKTLGQVLPQDAVDYISELVARDSAHEKFLQLTKD